MKKNQTDGGTRRRRRTYNIKHGILPGRLRHDGTPIGIDHGIRRCSRSRSSWRPWLTSHVRRIYNICSIYYTADAVARRSKFLLQRPSRRSVEKTSTSIVNLENRTYASRRRLRREDRRVGAHVLFGHPRQGTLEREAAG